MAKSSTAFLISRSNSALGNSTFSSPISAIISFWNWHNFFICSCPNINASNISFSLNSWAPASTIQIASSVPATVSDKLLASTCSAVGLITNSLPTLPTITPDTGPSKGILEMPRQRLVPNKAAISGELSGSTDNTVLTTCISWRKASSNIGLIGLSINLAAKVAASLGLPSLLINPPGILPTEYNFSWYKTCKGKKSWPTTSLPITQTDNTTVSP